MTDSQAKIGVTALGWTFTGVAIALTGCRYAVRVLLVGGLKLDDLLHGLALLGSIAFMVIDTFSLRQQYFSKADLPYYQRLAISSSLLGFVIVIYLVKFAFLVMYRNIFQVSRSFMLAWKAVCVFNGLCFVAGFLTYFWLCGSPYQTVYPEFCEIPVASLPRTVEIMVVACLLNSLSSIAVMALPLSMLHKLHIRTYDKIGLAAVFLLALADMLFDVVRTITTLKLISNVLEAMASLEPSIAVIASALAALGPLFRYRSRKRLASTQWSGDPHKIVSYGSSSRERSRRQHEEDSHGIWGDAHLHVPREMSAVQSISDSQAYSPALAPHQTGVSTRVSADHLQHKALPPEPRTEPRPPPPPLDYPPSEPIGVQRHTEVRIDVTSRYDTGSWLNV